jgi:V/A-type H+-transporting ATPase subunit D
MKQKVSPTRMELFRLKRRLELATRGHKLLKDKLEALVRELLPLIPKYKKLLAEVESTLGGALRRFALAEAASQAGAVETAVAQNVQPIGVSYEREWYMGVYLPKFGEPKLPTKYSYSFVETAAELDETVESMKELPALLLELARIEHSLFTIARELERTRRRTNALEYVVIPELKESRKEVEQKIRELERSDISRLMKVKEMLEEAQAARMEGRTPGGRPPGMTKSE